MSRKKKRKKRIKILCPEELKQNLIERKDKSEDFKELTLRLLELHNNDVIKVSEITTVPEATLYEWKREWNKKKRRGLENRRGEGGGRESRLRKEEKAELKALLKEKLYWTTKEVISLVKEKYNVSYSYVQMNRILREFI